MAERLEIGAEAPALAPAGRAGARPGRARSAGRRAGVLNEEPFAGYLTPERLHAAYGLPAETAAGSTQTIAVVDAFNDPTAEADLAVYDRRFGLPECTSANGCFTKLNQEGNAGPLPANNGRWASEISIDLQMAHAICQNCRILLVETKGEAFAQLGAGVNTAVAAGASVVSNSYGEPEAPALATLAGSDYSHPGIPILASSGDCGYLNHLCPARGTGAEFPAGAPGVIAVGGTSLSESEGVWTSRAWEAGGSGCSTVFEAGLWQSGAAGFSASGCGGYRAVADVSAVGDPNTGVNIYDSTPEEPGHQAGGWGVWGGTSVSSPIVAGEFALAGGGLGVWNPAATLYSHLGQAGALYDVTSGADGECAGASICSASAGYDGPTGVGSPVGLGAFALAGTPASTSPPTITGNTEQAEALSEHQGAWTGAPTSYSYQWERCGFTGAGCHPITGATGAAYTPGEADIGSTLRVRETALNSIGPGSADSAPVGPVASDVPAITGPTEGSGITGAGFILEGSALDTTVKVTLGALEAGFTVISPQRLEVTVPDGARTGRISVMTAHGSARSRASFKVTLAITSFRPAASPPGSAVSIRGTGFTSSSTVAFGGTPAAVTFVSPGKLRARVPAGAAAGPITVTNVLTPAGTVRSAASFTP